jgi:hypothetical protein
MTFRKWAENPFVIALGILASLGTLVTTLYAFRDNSSEEGHKILPVSPSSAPPTVSPKNLSIHVTDDDNKQSLEDVKVTVFSNGSPDSDKTDSNGYTYFPIPLNNPRVKLSLKKEGYQDQTFNIDVNTYADRPKEFSLKKKY